MALAITAEALAEQWIVDWSRRYEAARLTGETDVAESFPRAIDETAAQHPDLDAAALMIRGRNAVRAEIGLEPIRA